MIGSGLKTNLLRLWWGEVSLGRAFWGYLYGGLFVTLIGGMFFIILPIYLIALWMGFDEPRRIATPVAAVWGLLVAVYQGFACVGVWQSASRDILSPPYPMASVVAVLTKVIVIGWGSYILFNLWRNLPWLLLRVMG